MSTPARSCSSRMRAEIDELADGRRGSPARRSGRPARRPPSRPRRRGRGRSRARGRRRPVRPPGSGADRRRRRARRPPRSATLTRSTCRPMSSGESSEHDRHREEAEREHDRDLGESSDTQRAQTESRPSRRRASLKASASQEPSAGPSTRGRSGSASRVGDDRDDHPERQPEQRRVSPSSPSLMKIGLIDHATAVAEPGQRRASRRPSRPRRPARARRRGRRRATSAIPSQATRCGNLARAMTAAIAAPKSGIRREQRARARRPDPHLAHVQERPAEEEVDEARGREPDERDRRGVREEPEILRWRALATRARPARRRAGGTSRGTRRSCRRLRGG